MTTETKNTEEFRINGGEVWNKIKELVRAGNVRHLVLNNKKDEKILSMTVTIAAILAILAPQIVVILTIIALFFGCSIVIKKDEAKQN
ncbi:MAG: DUF4342 domain-containing protein [Candidatus Pacebacteria bacterium]|jgi:hypothetical protein|nr:DUF4342 domain-containing protein [Candidatus Paceibacterota bacterium]